MNRILNNWNLKLTALVLAVALWSHVRGEVNPIETQGFRAPLQVEKSPRARIDGETPRFVTVTLRAPRQTLAQLSQDEDSSLPNPLAPAEAPLLRADAVSARVRVPTGARGTLSLPVETQSRDADVQILSVQPSTIRLQLAR